MSEDNKDFLEKLKQFNEDKYVKDFYVPSLERSVKFSTLTAKHQKDIIHATLDNPILNLIFHDKVYKIMKELCHESEFIDSFTVYDKDAILIQMRYHFISKKYEGKDFSHVIENIKNIKLDLRPKHDEEDGINIQYRIPNIKQEYKILNEFSKSVNYSISPKDDNEIREIISNAYTIEIIKHVSKVQLIDIGSVVDFNNHTFKENSEVVDILGKLVCDKIHTFINDTRNNLSGIYKIDDKTTISIDSALFT